MNITIKPCFAFDVLCAIAHSKFRVIREGAPFLRDYMANITDGLTLPNSVSQISPVLRDALSLDEIESLCKRQIAAHSAIESQKQ